MNARLMVVPLQVELYDELMAAAPASPNSRFFARILAAQRRGETCLPGRLGLSTEDFQALLQRHFPLYPHECLEWEDERGALREQLLEMRHDEWLDVRNLLIQGAASDAQDGIWMAEIVAAACMGGGHLWRDLGMASRAELRELLVYHFPTVALRNDKDMKWKKFFYKQLCDQAGGYVCRSPSCEQCSGYDECFGPET